MFIKFTKDHPVGIKAGTCKKVKNSKSVDNGYAEEITEDEFNEWRDDFYKAKGEKKKETPKPKKKETKKSKKK